MEFRPAPKPKPKVKKPKPSFQRGGRKPKDAGRRYEASFAKKYAMTRVVGSGAFGAVDPTLHGDVSGAIGRKQYLIETKSYDRVDGRGEKIVTFPVAFLDKISKEAQVMGKIPLFIYHVKNSSEEWAVVRFDWLYETLSALETEIAELTLQVMEKNDNTG